MRKKRTKNQIKKAFFKFGTSLFLAVLLSVCLSIGAFAKDRSTYDVITDIVYTYKTKELEGYSSIQGYLKELKKLDKGLGETWSELMDYWMYVNNDLEVHMGNLPDGLPEDNSLCIVVLGFQLEPDGTMADELVGRCQTALECSKKYPNAYIAVTGGGTASDKKDITEADSMAQWLIKHGVKKDRIIVENESLTTVQNAQYTYAILSEQYPQITELAIVSSDYHVPLGCLMFKEELLFAANNTGIDNIHLISNAAYETGETHEEYTKPRYQWHDVWVLADPQ